MKKISGILAIFLALTIFIGSGLSGYAREAPALNVEIAAEKPRGDFVWRVQGGESRIYLMGTMHVVKPDYRLSQQVLRMLDTCDALAVESDTDNQKLVDAILGMSVYTDGTDIYGHLSARGRAHYEWLCKEYGIETEEFSAFRPFAAASVFELLPTLAAGYSGEGVDAMLMAKVRSEGKPILELEDGEAVYKRFLTLPDDTMERICILPISGPKESLDELNELYGLYLTGDAKAMIDFLNDGSNIGGDGQRINYEEKDGLYEQYMLDDRNRVMADRIEKWLKMPDRDVFVAAGLAHFLGDGSVIELLERDGYTVNKLKTTPQDQAQTAIAA